MSEDPENNYGSQTGGNDTAETSDTYEELSREEAEEITRSMESAMALWRRSGPGQNGGLADIVEVSRLKTPPAGGGRAGSVEAAERIWAGMGQAEVEAVKAVETLLLLEGEIHTDRLVQVLEGVCHTAAGLPLADLVPASSAGPAESREFAVDLMNHILYIFNQNEPPRITDDEDFCPSFRSSAASLAYVNQLIDQKEDLVAQKIDYLLEKAQTLGVRDIKIPVLPPLSEKAKLSLIKKQIQSKLKLKKLSEAISESKEFPNFDQKQKNRKSTICNKTIEINKKMRQENLKRHSSPVCNKPQPSSEWKDKEKGRDIETLKMKIIKTKKLLHELRQSYAKSVNEPPLSNESIPKQQISVGSIRKHLNTINKKKIFKRSTSYPPSIGQGFADFHKNIKLDFEISDKTDPTDELSSQKNIMSKSEDTETKSDLTSNRESKHTDNSNDSNVPPKKDKLRESTFEVDIPSMSLKLIKDNASAGDTRPQENSQKSLTTLLGPQTCQQSTSADIIIEEEAKNQCVPIQQSPTEDHIKIDIQRTHNKNEDFIDIKVIEEGIPLLWPLMKDKDKTLSTEICVSQFDPGPTVKLSLIKRVKSQENLAKMAKEGWPSLKEAICHFKSMLEEKQDAETQTDEEEQEKQTSRRESRKKRRWKKSSRGAKKTAVQSFGSWLCKPKVAEDVQPTVMGSPVSVGMALVVGEPYLRSRSSPYQVRDVLLDPQLQSSAGDLPDTWWCGGGRGADWPGRVWVENFGTASQEGYGLLSESMDSLLVQPSRSFPDPLYFHESSDTCLSTSRIAPADIPCYVLTTMTPDLVLQDTSDQTLQPSSTAMSSLPHETEPESLGQDPSQASVARTDATDLYTDGRSFSNVHVSTEFNLGSVEKEEAQCSSITTDGSEQGETPRLPRLTRRGIVRGYCLAEMPSSLSNVADDRQTDASSSTTRSSNRRSLPDSRVKNLINAALFAVVLPVFGPKWLYDTVTSVFWHRRVEAISGGRGRGSEESSLDSSTDTESED